MLPTPRWDPSIARWRLDLRCPWGAGRHLLDCPPPPSGTIAAVHAAYALLGRLSAKRPSGQLCLAGTGARSLAQLLDEYVNARTYRTAGGRRWVKTTAACVRHELGHLPLAELVGARGPEILWAWRDEIRSRPGRRVGPRAMQDRIVVLSMALRWASEPPRRWIPCVPSMPDPRIDESEAMWTPQTRWVEECTFRTVRDCIFSSGMSAGVLARLGHDPEDYYARRRLYLSFAAYTGMRRHDLDLLDDFSASLEAGCFWRWGRKTSAEEGYPEDMPPPLISDLKLERKRLGRPWYRGEPIAGGPWPNVCRVLAAACRRLGIEPFNLRDLRRSFCYHKALATPPVAEEDLVRLMGHADSRMIRAVYLQIPPASRRNAAGSAWPTAPAIRTGEPARVVPIRRAPGTHNAPTRHSDCQPIAKKPERSTSKCAKTL